MTLCTAKRSVSSMFIVKAFEQQFQSVCEQYFLIHRANCTREENNNGVISRYRSGSSSGSGSGSGCGSGSGSGGGSGDGSGDGGGSGNSGGSGGGSGSGSGGGT